MSLLVLGIVFVVIVAVAAALLGIAAMDEDVDE